MHSEAAWETPGLGDYCTTRPIDLVKPDAIRTIVSPCRPEQCKVILEVNRIWDAPAGLVEVQNDQALP